ncbi:unnamed protein product [Victoria cruziana]
MSFEDLERERQSGRRRDVGEASQNASQGVAAGIFQINTAVSSFKRLVDAIGTSRDTPDHRQKLHNTRQRIGQLVKDASAKLKALTEDDHRLDASASKKIEHAKLARDFQTVLKDYQKVQQLAAERETAYKPSLPPSASASSSGFDELNTTSLDLTAEKQLWRDQKRQEILLLDNEVAFNEAIIDEREQGIKDIEEQIGQVNDIFKDLAVLVHEQGVIIDDIDSNIESSYSATVQAKTQVVKAAKSVKSRSSWSCWLLVVFIVVIIVFVLIFVI